VKYILLICIFFIYYLRNKFLKKKLVKKKIICFDLDNVICTTKENKYSQSKPKKKIIKLINYLYSSNFYIKIFTARSMGRFNGNKIKVLKHIKKITLEQLKKWSVNYHEMIFFKPSYDIFIDDKSLGHSIKNWPSQLIHKLKIKKKINCNLIEEGK